MPDLEAFEMFAITIVVATAVLLVLFAASKLI